MGNCLKGSNSDDISLLRDSISRSNLVSEHSDPATLYSEIIQPGVYATSTVNRSPNQLPKDEDLKVAKRIGLIQHLPIGIYDGSRKSRECVICMIEFCVDEAVRYLPCMHIYHVGCIDDWLMRSLTCPSCMEPVDSALLKTYETT